MLSIRKMGLPYSRCHLKLGKYPRCRMIVDSPMLSNHCFRKLLNTTIGLTRPSLRKKVQGKPKAKDMMIINMKARVTQASSNQNRQYKPVSKEDND